MSSGICGFFDCAGPSLWENKIEGLSDDQARDLFLRLQKETQVGELLDRDEVVSRFPFEIHCAKESAIQLQDKRYLHANRMGKDLYPHHPLIATQCPPGKALETFWLGVWENPGLIVDLTTSKDYCYPDMNPYYPDEGQTLKTENIQVTCHKWDWDLGTRSYELKRAGEETKVVVRYHFHDWIDSKAVEVRQLQELVGTVESLASQREDSIWVHCLAGVGRTGTLIAALILKEQIREGKITAENLQKQLVDLILKLRRERNDQMVQTWVQLKLLYDFSQTQFGKIGQ